ncbi:hypothetical protein PtB15_5B633 [Puccinia triticina]|nr:hypothetical protein PtB15_5B633 [Puccinia triticina]
MNAGQQIDRGAFTEEELILTGDAWSRIRDKLNEACEMNVTTTQAKSQKNSIRETFLDYRFLINHPGFTWDSVKSKVTAEQNAWDRLRPRSSLTKYKDKKFPFELASQVFNHTQLPTTTSEDQIQTADQNQPSTSSASPDGTEMNSGQKRIRPDDSGIDVPDYPEDPAVTPSKRPRNTSSSYQLPTIGTQTAQREDGPEDSPAPLRQGSTFKQAIESLTELFADKIDQIKFSHYVCILAIRDKAEYFMFLYQNSNEELCQKWLDEETRRASLTTV